MFNNHQSFVQTPDGNTIESRTVKNIVTWLLTFSFALYSLSSTLPTAYGMMQVLQEKKSDSKSKIYSIYGIVIKGTFVREEGQIIHFRDLNYPKMVRKFNKNEIYKLVLPDGTIYFENNSLKATYERNFTLREKELKAISFDDTRLTAFSKNVPAWENEMLIVHFRDGTTKRFNKFLFMDGKDLLAEDTLLYKIGKYAYKTSINKISTIEVKRFNKDRSLKYTIPTVLALAVIFGAIVHRKVHFHHGGD